MSAGNIRSDLLLSRMCSGCFLIGIESSKAKEPWWAQTVVPQNPSGGPHPKREGFISHLSTPRGCRIRLYGSLYSLQSFHPVAVCVLWRQPSVISKRKFCNCQWKGLIKGDVFSQFKYWTNVSLQETKIQQMWEAQIWLKKRFLYIIFFQKIKESHLNINIAIVLTV